MRVPVVWCIRLASRRRESGRPWTDCRSERGAGRSDPGSLALGTSSWRWLGTVDDHGHEGAGNHRYPGRATAHGTKRPGGGPHEQGLEGPGDSLRCCRMDSADGLSTNYCKRLRVGAQANPGVGLRSAGPWRRPREAGVWSEQGICRRTASDSALTARQTRTVASPVPDAVGPRRYRADRAPPTRGSSGQYPRERNRAAAGPVHGVPGMRGPHATGACSLPMPELRLA